MRRAHIRVIEQIGWAFRVVARGIGRHECLLATDFGGFAMSAIITTTSRPLVLPGRSILAALAAVGRLFRRLAQTWRNRRDAAALARLDDRMLADMGLTHGDVRDAFAGPLWHDPTNLLRARALERRLSRHRASLGLQEAPPLVPHDDFRRPLTSRPARFTV